MRARDVIAYLTIIVGVIAGLTGSPWPVIVPLVVVLTILGTFEHGDIYRRAFNIDAWHIIAMAVGGSFLISAAAIAAALTVGFFVRIWIM